MKINRHNYEAYLLDLLEGNLSVEDQQQVHNFLLLNPDCARELMEIEPWVLEEKKVSFQNRQLLKKEFPNHASVLSDLNFDLFSIARMEGDLSEKQEEDHQSTVAIDEKRSTLWSQWQQTRLVPETVKFKGKGQLLRKNGTRNRVIWISLISAAASLALLFALFRTEPELPKQEHALQTPQLQSPQQAIDAPVLDADGRVE